MLLVVHLAFGSANIWHGLARTNLLLFALVLLVGIAQQIVRAERAAIMLSGEQAVTTGQSFTSMVVSHGIGDLLPLIPGGPLLRAVLLRRGTGLALSFAIGVFTVEGVLDTALPALGALYLLLVATLPHWLNLVFAAALTQAVVCVAAPVLLAVLVGRLCRRVTIPARLRSVVAIGECLAAGFRCIMTRGRHRMVSVAALTAAIGAMSMVQLQLALHAFALHTPAINLLVLLVVTQLMGSIPIKIPGSGSVAVAAVLPVLGLHGAGAAAYLLISRAIFANVGLLLAVVVIGWWTARGNRQALGIRAMFRAARRGDLESAAMTVTPSERPPSQ